MTRELEFYFDYSCPYAYLASTRVRELADKTGARLAYRPFLLGGVFRALDGVASEVTTMVPARARLNALDMHRWAELWGAPLNMPKTHPNRTVTALRATLASGDVPRACHALFAAYWGRGEDLSDERIVAGALDGAGFDGSELVRRAGEHKDELRAQTDDALSRGVFGAPAFFVDGELYWGQDRMDFVARALGGRGDELSFAPLDTGAAVREVEIWYDFSSPFAYLGAMRIEEMARRKAATVRWRPFLLGALFREIGTPDVPLHSFSQAKQRYVAQDLERFAKRHHIPFSFPTRFPIRSVLPLRVALAAEGAVGAVSTTLFTAAWAEDRDISDAATLRSVLSAAGHTPDLVDVARQDHVKLALRQNTSEAVERGLCGAPTFAVGQHLFWGQDRLKLVGLALSGWKPRAG